MTSFIKSKKKEYYLAAKYKINILFFHPYNYFFRCLKIKKEKNKIEKKKEKDMDKWTSALESNPSTNGIYYVYIMNCMDNSSDIRKFNFQNGEWQLFGDENDKIIAWKNIPEHEPINKKDTDKWLKEHLNEIKLAFNYNYDIDYSWFCIVETLTECLCAYPWFLCNNYVRYVDNVFVVRVL